MGRAWLFAEIRRQLARPDARVSATYDPNTGFPTHVSFDPYPAMVDDEVSIVSGNITFRLEQSAPHLRS